MLEAKVREIILGILDVTEEDLVPTATFEDLHVTSLDLVTLLTAFENEFGISIEDDAVSGAMTLHDAIAFLKERIAAKKAVI